MNRLCALLVIYFCFTSISHAFDLASSTPIGSWQTREEISTDHKGKQSAAVVTVSLLEKESRNGSPFVWIEMHMQNFKIKKDKRKADGDPMTMKVLVPEARMHEDAASLMTNLRGFGEEIILQSGDDEPILISNSGMLAQQMLAAMGAEFDFDFRETGSEKWEVPAGSFTCTMLEGEGESRTKIMFKEIVIHSKSRTCITEKVPFGIVYGTAVTTSNGDDMHTETRLLDFGMSGAKTRIKGEPVAAPEMPSMYN